MTGSKNVHPPADGEAFPSDDAFEILRNSRRRRALRILAGRDEAMELTDLAREIASIENDKSPDAVTATERKRVYISLYQCHVSKMIEAGLIEYDEDARIVTITPQGVDLADGLAAFATEGSDSVVPTPAVAVAAFGLAIVAFYASAVSIAMLFLGVGLSFALLSYRCAVA